MLLHEHQAGGRQERGDDRPPGLGRADEGGDPLARWRGQVVGGDGADLGRQLGAARRDELVGMEARRQPVTEARLEHPTRLLDAEHAALAEDVAEAGDALRLDGRQLLFDDRRRRRPRRRPVGHGSPAARRGHRGTSARCRSAPRRPSRAATSRQAQLGGRVEAVPGLGLDRRHAVPEHLVQPAPAVGVELVGRRGARLLDGREDAAAGGQDLEIPGALLAEADLGLAGARRRGGACAGR